MNQNFNLKGTKQALRLALTGFATGIFVALFCAVAIAQTYTTVADTIRGPGGSQPNGNIQIIANSTFTAADGTVVVKGPIDQFQIVRGTLNIPLIPNAGSTPSGTSYMAIYNLNGLAPWTETWVVPSIPNPATLADVRTSPTPTPSTTWAMDQIVAPSNCISLGGIAKYTSSGWTCAQGGADIQTNGTSNADQSTLNFETSTANAVGLTLTPISSAGGVMKFEITGSSYTGNAATATALAATPTNCGAGSAATGVDASGDAVGCFTPSAPVTSVFSRTGAVTATSGDYTAAQVTNAFDKGANNDLGAHYFDIGTQAAPANPAAGSLRLYADSTSGLLACLDSGGASCLPAGGGVGTSTSGQFLVNNAGAVSGTAPNGSTITEDGSGNVWITPFGAYTYLGNAANNSLVIGQNPTNMVNSIYFGAASTGSSGRVYGYQGSVVIQSSTSPSSTITLGKPGAGGTVSTTGQFVQGRQVISCSGACSADLKNGSILVITITGAVTGLTVLNAQAGSMMSIIWLEGATNYSVSGLPASWFGIAGPGASTNTYYMQTCRFDGTNGYCGAQSSGSTL